MSDPALCLCPGLFRNLTAADLDIPVELRIAYTHGKTVLRVRGPLLSGFDLAILQAIELVAKTTNELVSVKSQGGQADLVSKLASNDPLDDDQAEADEDAPVVLHGPRPEDDMCYASCSIAHLLRTIGLPVNSHYTKQAAESLGNLSAVTLFVAHVDTPNQFQSLHLLAHLRVAKDNRRAHVVQMALHPRLTSALLSRSPQDVRISVDEMRKLGTNAAARVLHQRLCAIINDGVKRPFKVSTLMEYLYPADKSGIALERLRSRNAQAAYDYRKRKLEVVHSALKTLGNDLNWEIATASSEMTLETTVDITRPMRTWTHRQLRAAKQAALADAAEQAAAEAELTS